MTSNNPPKPIIFGVSGTSLTDKEREAYAKINPLGFVLFKKNLVNKKQSKKLCSELREVIGRDNAPILVDQEGGRVIRLTSPIWREAPAALELAKFAYSDIKNSLERTSKLVNLNAQLIAYQMQEIGINFNCAPVADLLFPDAHHITSLRSFGPNHNITSILVNSMIDGMSKYGVHAIIKHMLGQGRAKIDSHLSLPIVSDNLKTLEENDFAVFKNAKNANWGMTAHIKYEHIDKIDPVTYSKKAIDYIRNIIGFKGILISDCLTMKSLPETLEVRTQRTIAAGIDIALYGGSNLDDLKKMAQRIPSITDNKFSKITDNLKELQNFQNSDYNLILIEYNALLKSLQIEFNSLPESNFSSNLKLILKTIRDRKSMNADYSSPLYKA
jgi:beta-N-acetylhexosaminidase